MKDALGNTIGFGDYVMYIANNGFRYGRIVGMEVARPPWRVKNPPVPFIRLKANGLRQVSRYTSAGQQPNMVWEQIQSYLTASGRVIKISVEQVPAEQRDTLTRLMGW